METIGKKIYNLRTEKNISQEKLAEKLNVSRQTVSRWETDISKPTKRNLKSLCVLCGVDKNYFSDCGEVATVDAMSQEIYTKSKDLKIFALIAISIFLICCTAACGVASYVAFLPSYVNNLDNAAANRFHYIGIVCVVVGALALTLLICLIVIAIKTKKCKK